MEDNKNIHFKLYSERPEVIIEREREARNRAFADKFINSHRETFDKLKENDEGVAHSTPDNTPDNNKENNNKKKKKYIDNRKKR